MADLSGYWSADDPRWLRWGPVWSGDQVSEGGAAGHPYYSIIAGLDTVENWESVAAPLKYVGPFWIEQWVDMGGEAGMGSVRSVAPMFQRWIDSKKNEGFAWTVKFDTIQNYNMVFSFVHKPSGSILVNRIVKDNTVENFFTQFVLPVFGIAGGFLFLGQQAAALTGLQPQTAASIIRTVANVAVGGDFEKSIIGSVVPAVISDYGPSTIFDAPDLGEIQPEILEVPGAAAELLAPPVLLPELLPEVLPELLPVYYTDAVVELLEPPVLPPELLPEVLPESLEVENMPFGRRNLFTDVPDGMTGMTYNGQRFLIDTESRTVYTQESYGLDARGSLDSEQFAGMRNLIDSISETHSEYLSRPLPAPLPEVIPTTVPEMNEFFVTQDAYFGLSNPVDTVDAGWFTDIEPMPEFPIIEPEDMVSIPEYNDPFYQEEMQDLISVPDLTPLTPEQVDSFDGLIGADGSVEIGGVITAPSGSGRGVVEVIKDTTAAMTAALGLVEVYRRLVGKPPINPVAQSRVGSATMRANPDGTITTTNAQGRTSTSKPPVGQPQMATDGSMIVNNGDGTYTRITRDGGSVVNRYPLDITQRFAPAASSYTLPLVLAGGAALLIFATRKR